MELEINFSDIIINGNEVETDFNLIPLFQSEVFDVVTIVGKYGNTLDALRTIKIGGKLYVDEDNNEFVNNFEGCFKKIGNKGIMHIYEAI